MEENRESSTIRSNNRKSDSMQVRVPKRSFYWGLIVLAVIASFIAGDYFGHNKGSTTVATANTQSSGTGNFGSGGGYGGGGGFRNGGSRGSVTAISSTSITVDDSRSGTSKTYTINSSTQISDNGSTVTTSDIQTGDTVFVMASSSTSTTATRILVNPSFGGQSSSGSGNSTSN